VADAVEITGAQGERYEELTAKLPGDPSDYDEAWSTFLELAVADDFAEFLTLPACERMP
jgi:malate synthase